MKLQIIVILIAFAGLSGCVSVKPDLWQPLPNEIIIETDITYKNRQYSRGELTLPAGHYVLKHQNKDGYYYVLEGGTITERVMGVFGKTTNAFNGGLHLWNRPRIIEVYELMPLDSEKNRTGEMGGIAASLAGDKDGNVRLPHSYVPEDLWSSLKIEGGSMKEK